MSWRKPGEPYTNVVDGVKIKCKSIKYGKRMELAANITESTDDNDTVVDRIYDLVKDQVISVDADLGGLSPQEAIECQSTPFVMALWKLIIQGGSLTGDEAKNSGSSSDAPQASFEENITKTAEKTDDV